MGDSLTVAKQHNPSHVIDNIHQVSENFIMTTQGLPTLQRLGSGVLPIPTFVIHRDLNGLQTELSIQVYDDRIMVLLSQLGNKVGCLVSHFSIGDETSILTAAIRT